MLINKEFIFEHRYISLCYIPLVGSPHKTNILFLFTRIFFVKSMGCFFKPTTLRRDIQALIYQPLALWISVHVTCITNIPWKFLGSCNSLVTKRFLLRSSVAFCQRKQGLWKKNISVLPLFVLDGSKFRRGEQTRLELAMGKRNVRLIICRVLIPECELTCMSNRLV